MQREHRIKRATFIAGSAAALAACSATSPVSLNQRVGATSPSDALRGRWKVVPTPSATLLSIQFVTGGNEHTQMQFLISGYSAARSPSGRAMAEPASVRFVSDQAVLASDAGNIVLVGYPRSSAAIKNAVSGDARFHASKGYFDSLSEHGLLASPLQKVSLALRRVSLRDVGIITKRFPDATLEAVIMVYVFGFTAADVQQLKVKAPDLTTAQLLAKLPFGFAK
jgi:hypothetical protein